MKKQNHKEKEIKERILTNACKKANKYYWKVDYVEEAINEAFRQGKLIGKELI